MWYVMQVPTGRERFLQERCREAIAPPVLEKSFLPYYDEMVRKDGVWTIQRRVLFPGYVFMITREPEELRRQLRKVNGWKTLLTSGGQIVPITPAEEEFLRRFGNEDQIVHASRGIIADGQVVVLEGPLKGHEAYIRKIDRHKRRAYLELHLFQEVIETRVSLEIFAKNETVNIPDAMKLLAEKRQEEPTASPAMEDVRPVTLLRSDHAAVSLEDTLSVEEVRRLYQINDQDGNRKEN